MLGIGFKLSETPVATLRSSFSAFLRNEYASEGDKMQEKLHDTVLDQFVQLKTDVDLVHRPSATSRHVLLRYYAQLDKLAQRFPCNNEASNLHLQFTWNDSFCPRIKSTQMGVSFEKAAVMFNVGALESQLGLQTDRISAGGLKAACHHFMRAAGAFAEVKDKIVEQILGARTPDMSAEGLELLTYLMLAQAQACFYEKAIKDQMKAGIKAKLVHQALDYYVSALEFCRSSALAGVIDRSWDVHLQFQVYCMRAATQYWQGTASKAVAQSRGAGYGEEIARLIAADLECTEACTVATQNKLSMTLLQSAQSLQRMVRDHLALAQKDNASVYLENIPRLSDLPAVGKVAMVNPLPFTTEEVQQELGGVDLFEQFVPKELLHRARSVKQEIYTILEQTADTVSKSTKAANEKLDAMGLPASIEAFDKASDNGIPHTIWHRIQTVKVTTAATALDHAGWNENPTVSFIQQQLQENQRLSDEAERKLHAIELQLGEEEGEDSVCRQTYGEQKWGRPVSSSLHQNFRADIDRYYRLVKEAKTADALVQEKVESNHENLEALSRSKARLDRELPKLVQDDSSCKEEIAQVSSLLLQWGQLGQEKDQVVRDFKDAYEKFNALPVLLSKGNANSISTDAALEKEKQFFSDHLIGKIDNICKVEQALLDTLVLANSCFEAKRETDDMLRERQAYLQHLSDAVDEFEQLESHVKEGAKFYRELSIRIAQLHQTVADYCSARALEKRELEINLTANREMRQREAADAALAHTMMNDMQLRDAEGGRNASDEALARQLAGTTPQYYQANSPPHQSARSTYDVAQQLHVTPQLGNAATPSVALPPYGSNYSQPPQQRQSYNFYQYPGQQPKVHNPFFPRGHPGDSV